MKSSRLLLVFALGLGLVLLVFAALPGRSTRAAPACNRYVVDGGTNFLNSCSDPTKPCKTVQYALGRANQGDRICVADDTAVHGPSVYTGTIVITKSVTLDGAWEATFAVGGGVWGFASVRCDQANVMLDAQGAGRVISITGAIAPTIQCFVITGGNANDLGGNPSGSYENDAGGGIYSLNAAPVIVGNVITGNHACELCAHYGIGGGIFLRNAPATAVIRDNVIDSNAGGALLLGWGGGIALRDSSAQVLSNTIQRNTGGTVGDGGGMYVIDGSPTIAGNTIVTNTAAGSGVMGNGAGLFISSSLTVTIERNIVEGNIALKGTGGTGLVSRGGGIYYEGSYAIIRDNTIRDNTAVGHGIGAGGGMYLRNLTASAIVSGNSVDGNIASFDMEGSGGGIYADASGLILKNNQIVGNSATWSGDLGQGGGLYVNGGGVLIRGNTISNNDAAAWLGSPAHATGFGGGVAISGSQSIVQDNWIVQNRGTNSGGTGGGGGVYGLSSTLQVIGNHVLSNTTGSGNGGFGGGLYLESSRAYLDGNTILDNRATGNTLEGRGGGVRINSCPAFTLTNNIIARNAVSTTGSGVAVIVSTGRLDYNTIADNLIGDGVGVRADSSSNVTLTNNIIANQTTGISNTGSVVNAQYTLFEGNGQNYSGSVTSANEVPGPAALQDDYHLKNWSNAIDHATPLTWVTTDVDGDHRPFGTGYDVGADEAACNRFALNTDGSDPANDCRDPAHPCRTVQRALNQALDGDHICVAHNPLQLGPAVYTGTNTVNKSVALDGAWQAACVDPSDLTCAFTAVPCNPANVVLDAQGAGRVIDINGSITPTVRCFTLTGGHANTGAGINVNSASATIASNIITGNVADSYGGGINVESAGVVITANAVLSNSATNGGGGIELNGTTATLGNNRIAENRATYGGGLELDRASVTATANLVIHNQSSSAWMISGGEGYRLVAVNNAMVDNGGTAFRIYSYHADLVHNTIVSNTGNAVEGYYTATLVLTNNVIAYNTGAGIFTGSGGSAVATYNLFWGNGSDPITGTHAVLGSPALLADGYHIGPSSAAIDRGAATWLTTDIDGNPRPIGPLPDIGADERRMYVYLPMILRN